MQGKKDPYEKKSTDGSRHMYWNFDSYRRQQVFCQNQKCQKQLFAMDTYMEFTAYGKNSEKL